jgi:two-component sensor histidine kinase/PAS domain-containing protein
MSGAWWNMKEQTDSPAMDGAVQQIGGLKTEDLVFLARLEEQLPFLADISRADVLLYGCQADDKAIVLLHASPHSISPVYNRSLQGYEMGPGDEPRVFRALTSGHAARGSRGLIAEGAPIVQEVYPVFSPGNGWPIAALAIETNLIENERHRRRSKEFQKALQKIKESVLRAELAGIEELSPFGEHDGVMVVDVQKRIRYVSGIATNLYRKIGYAESLLGRSLTSLETADDELVTLVMRKRRCLQRETTEGDERIWIRKGVPLYASPGGLMRLRKLLGLPPLRSTLSGVLLTIHDATERIRKEEELRVKTAMIQEVHHRVKNNLQTIVALLHLQARRVESEEARQVLEEGINRILSVAVIHEFLSHQESRVINVKDVSQRIINQMRRGVMDPEKHIRLKLEGPNVYLPARQATACALVINELLQNAVVHGYKRKTGGTISVILEDTGDQVSVTINDDGRGLPVGFNLENGDSLGLQIVQTLVSGDLRGHFELRDGDGVSAIVTFPKATLGGEE